MNTPIRKYINSIKLSSEEIEEYINQHPVIKELNAMIEDKSLSETKLNPLRNIILMNENDHLRKQILTISDIHLKSGKQLGHFIGFK
jgi:hypothetical protein